MSEAARDLNGPYIVYADDDPDDLFLVKEMLRSINPEVVMHGCENGKDVYSFLESLPPGKRLPGAVILDLNMPGWNGSKTLETLKRHENYKEIPVFIFTNSDHPAHREKAIEMGAVGFITKPYSKKDLITVCHTFAMYASNEFRLKSA